MVVSCSPLPSACSRICRGTVYPAAFFQFEMQAGTFQSFWSWAVSCRGGDLRMTGGGSLSPLGTFLCLWRGGSSGSSCCWTIWMIRDYGFSLFLTPICVYSKNTFSSFFLWACDARKAGSFFFATLIPNYLAVSFKFRLLSVSVGLDKSWFCSSLADFCGLRRSPEWRTRL